MGSFLEVVLLERCDGNRNIFYVCVFRSFLIFVYEFGELVEFQSGSIVIVIGVFGNKLEFIKGVVDVFVVVVVVVVVVVRLSGRINEFFVED